MHNASNISVISKVRSAVREFSGDFSIFPILSFLLRKSRTLELLECEDRNATPVESKDVGN
jgi:hypothetical protein